jgi:hypothetical protein
VNQTAVADIVRVGLGAVAFILFLKFVFLHILKVPGLSNLVAAI